MLSIKGCRAASLISADVHKGLTHLVNCKNGSCTDQPETAGGAFLISHFSLSEHFESDWMNLLFSSFKPISFSC